MSKNKLMKVASDLKMGTIIRFLQFKKSFPTEIHSELKAAYGDNVMSIQYAQKWCRLLNKGRVMYFQGHAKTAPLFFRVTSICNLLDAT